MDKWAIPRVRLVRMARLWKRLSYKVLRCFRRKQNFQIRIRWTRKPAWWANINSWLGGALISISRNLFEPYWLRHLELTLCMCERFRLSEKQALGTNSCYRADECTLLNMASKLNRDESDSSPVDSKPACQPQRVQQFGDVFLIEVKGYDDELPRLYRGETGGAEEQGDKLTSGEEEQFSEQTSPSLQKIAWVWPELRRRDAICEEIEKAPCFESASLYEKRRQLIVRMKGVHFFRKSRMVQSIPWTFGQSRCFELFFSLSSDECPVHKRRIPSNRCQWR